MLDLRPCAAATSEEDATNHAARIHGRRRLHQLPTGGVAACERNWFSRERIARRRASEAGARASTQREAYRSTRVVGAGRTGPIWSASDAVGEQPGLESGGSHRVPPARPVTPKPVNGLLGAVGFGSAGFPSLICYRSLSRLRLQETSFFCLHLLRV